MEWAAEHAIRIYREYGTGDDHQVQTKTDDDQAGMRQRP